MEIKNKPDALNEDLSPIAKEPPQHVFGASKGKAYDHEMGFDVVKLGKQDAEKVASMLADRMSSKIGTRHQRAERAKWLKSLEQKKEAERQEALAKQ